MKKSRQAAIDALEPWYNTGKPCKNGHLSKRNTLDGSCWQCRQHKNEKDATWRRELCKKIREHQKKLATVTCNVTK